MVTSKKRRGPAREEGYFIRALSAPMRLSATGELCSRTFVATGTTLTIGRSKKGCDVVFEDARVSRKHCQLCLIPDSNSLVLLDGSTTLSHGIAGSQFAEELEIADANKCASMPQTRIGALDNRCIGSHSKLKSKCLSKYLPGLPSREGQLVRRIRKNAANTKASKQSEGKTRNMQDISHAAIGQCRRDGKERPCEESSSVFHHNVASGPWKPSLNGIFVNGHVFKERMMILMPGDEVSLVGPTEGGRSLDFDCPKAVGFVVEIQPSAKKAQPAPSCLSLRMLSQHIVGDNFSALNTGTVALPCVLHDAGMVDHIKRISLDNQQSAQPDNLSRKLLCHNQRRHEHLPTGNKSDVKHLSGTESDTLTGDSSTGCCKSSGSADAIQGKILSPVKIDKLQSGKNMSIKQAAHSKQAGCSIDLDSKLLSTFDLVKASIRLRSDLLNSSTLESSHAVKLMNTEEKICFGRESIPCQKNMEHGNLLLEYTMPTVDAVVDVCDILTECQGGDYACEKHVSLTFENTVKVDSSPWRQVTLPDNVLFKKLDNYGVTTDEKGVAVPLNSVLVHKEGTPLKGYSTSNRISKDVDANMSQRTRTLLVSQTNCLSDTSENAFCKMKVFDCLQTVATSGDSVQEAVSGKFSKEVHNDFHALAVEELNEKVVEEAAKKDTPPKPAHVNDIFQLMFETQIGGLTAATACLNVFQVKEELSGGQASLKKENANVLQCADEGCSIGEGLIQGQVVKYGVCNIEEGKPLDFQKDHQVHSHDIEPKVAKTFSHSPLAGAEASECMVTYEGCVSGDRDFSVVKNDLSFSKTDNERTIEENVYNNVPRTFDPEDTYDVQDKGPCTVRELEPQKMTRNLNGPQFLGVGICISELPAAEICHSARAILRDGDFCKKEASQRILEPAIESSAALHDHGDFCKEEGSQRILEPAFESAADHGGAKPTNDACLEQVCDDSREGNAATEVAIEQSKSFHRHDSTCTDSLMVNSQVDEKVKRMVLDEQNCSTRAAGYYLNQLKDAATGAPIYEDNSVCLWDLLALTNDVQALFIATFTYDLEWFLSSAGLSRDTPVTVACHNAKHCWSMASKDRCEKPYLEWPNITLVYPPFPRSNAFGKGQGIGCHHPKIFLLRRKGSLRVIVSSANLTSKQWFNVTNNVWWQDFPCRQTPDFRCLFQGEEESNSTATPDFAAQLAIFLAALLVDAPSEAHWVTDLAAFDFSDAAGSLVASVPGLHQHLYQNAPQFLTTLNKDAYSPSVHGNDFVSHHLGVVPTTVAGIRYRFCASADRNGTRIRSLAAVLNDVTAHEASTMPVLLKRAKFLKADPNAVSVIVTSRAKGCSQDLFLQEDLYDAEINTMESDTLHTEEGFIKLGFLPRDIARWLAVLCDRGFFSFAACIWPSEALAVASGQCDAAVKLALYVFQGPKFSTLSPTLMTSEECGAFSGLLKSLHNTWGLWRLEKVLRKYNWIDSQETDFYVASSSIGTSLDAKFFAAFAAAAGRRAESMTLSQESDPQWGCWTAEQEAANPSIRIVFPSIDRVRQDNFMHYGLLCFAESAWLRLKSARLLHDAVPFPSEREGFPMHIKVARRRFQDSLWSQPYGWMYCGSHNFSPAAWGRPIWRARDWEAATDAGSILGSSLHICNYELGIVLMEPPPDAPSKGKNESNRVGLDRFILPFKVPPPIYRESDRPATGRAMMEAYLEIRDLQLKAAAEEDLVMMQSEDLVEEASNVQEEEDAPCKVEGEEARAEQVYVEALWSQIDEEQKTDESK